MMKIANVVSSIPINVDNNFNVVTTLNDIIIGLPTLLIGLNVVEELYPDFDITEMKVDEDVYWSFSKNERRDEYFNSIYIFTTKTYEHLVSHIVYIYLDVIHYSHVKIKKIIDKIKILNNSIAYQYGDMIYIYGDNLIFGIDLRVLTYIGFDIIRIKSKIINLVSRFLLDEKILIEYKSYMDRLNNSVKFIPYLYSMNINE